MSIKNKDEIVFGEKSLSDLLEDIYLNSKKKDKTISDIMTSFLSSLQGGKDIGYIGPVIKDLLDVGVKNDEQLVKIATIVQRIMTGGGSSDEDELGLSDKMKEELLATLEEAKESDSEIQSEIESVEERKELGEL